MDSDGIEGGLESSARGRVVGGCNAGHIDPSTEKIEGSPGPDVLTGDNGANVLLGRGGGDELDGKGGEDKCVGGGGHDQATACEKVASVP